MGDPSKPAPRMPMPDDGSAYAMLYLQRLKGQDPPGSSQATDESPSVVTNKDEDAVSIQTRNEDAVSVQSKEDDIVSIISSEGSLFGGDDEPLNAAQDQGMAVQQPEEVINLEGLHVSASAPDNHPRQPDMFNSGTLFCGRPLQSARVVPQYQQPQPPQAPPPQDDDDDDDLMIIDASEVADHVKALFASRSKPFVTEDPDLEIIDVKVKQEPGSPQLILEEVPEHQSDSFGDLLPEPAMENLPLPEPPEPDIEEPDIKREVVPSPVAAVVVNQDEDDEEMFVDEHVDAQQAADNNPGPSYAQDVIPMDIDGGHNDGDGQGSNDNQVNTADQNGTIVNSIEMPIEIDSDGDNDDEYVIADDHELSDGEQFRSRRRKPAQKKKKPKQPPRKNGKEVSVEDPELSLEDLQEEAGLLQAELKLYERRKAKGKMVPTEMEHIEIVAKRYAILKQKLAALSSGVPGTQPVPAGPTENGVPEELRQMMEIDDSDNDTPTESSARPGEAGPGPSTAKRKRQQARAASPKSGVKKRKTIARRGARVKARISKATEMILEMVRAEDPILARAQMDEVSVFGQINDPTLTGFLEKLRQEAILNPRADRERVEHDYKQLVQSSKMWGGPNNCKPHNGVWQIKGLEKGLHHYQLVGAGWMLTRERTRNPHGPFGGILADQTGLGKTIEALACIVGHQQPKKERAERYGTLIVVPSNLVAQWHEEIEQCCPSLTKIEYHGGKRHGVRIADLKKADIVLTTYYEVSRGYPNKDTRKEWEHLQEPARTQAFNDALGFLFTVDWYRIVLDEAHVIKNHHSHTSLSCNALQGKYRWALTATPVHNGLHELYAYMQFIRANVAMTSKEFNIQLSGKITSPEDENHPSVKEILGDVLFMRKLKTLFMGKALFEIPKTHPLPNVWISLSEEETIVYRRIEEKIRELFNRVLEGQMVEGHNIEKKKVANTFFSVTVRLRQAAAHPFLLFTMMRDTFELEDIQIIKDQMAKVKERHPDRPFIDQIGRWMERREQDQLQGDVSRDNQQRSYGKGRHGLEFNMQSLLETLEKMKTGGASMCTICSEAFRNPRRTLCGHTFCKQCVDDLIDTQTGQGNDTIHCPTCKAENNIEVMMGVDFNTADGSLADSQAGSQPGGRRRRGSRKDQSERVDMPGNDARNFQPLGAEDSAGFLDECDKDISLTMAPSAKTAVVKDIILRWRKEYPNDKIIVFTQWVQVARILGRVLDEEDIRFLYYFGEMDQPAKDVAVKLFHRDRSIRVLVSSLKAGGQGLNLTCANRVILIDPWWNTAMEQQGYGRIFRMGQTKETYYVRLLTRKTIDGRMARLQAQKLKEINTMVKEYDSTQNTPKFEEVAELFGRVHYDDDGNVLRVDSDYDTDEGGDEAANAGPSGPADDMDSDEPGPGSSESPDAGGGNNGYGIQDLLRFG